MLYPSYPHASFSPRLPRVPVGVSHYLSSTEKPAGHPNPPTHTHTHTGFYTKKATTVSCNRVFVFALVFFEFSFFAHSCACFPFPFPTVVIKLRIFSSFFRFSAGEFLVAFLLDFILFSLLLFVWFFFTSRPLVHFPRAEGKKLICKFCLWHENIYNKLNLQPKRTEPNSPTPKLNQQTEKEATSWTKRLTKCLTNCVYAAWSPLDKWKCLLDFLALSPCFTLFWYFWFDRPAFRVYPQSNAVLQKKIPTKCMQHHKLQPYGVARLCAFWWRHQDSFRERTGWGRGRVPGSQYLHYWSFSREKQLTASNFTATGQARKWSGTKPGFGRRGRAIKS